MTSTGSAELRDVYEEQYNAGSAEGIRYGQWRALCAQGKADHVVQLARLLAESPRLVAEVGCGDGGVLSALAARGLGERRHGFEISERAVQLAAGRPEIERVQRFDGATLPASDGAYDLGVLSHVLEHVPDPVPLLAETARACRAVVVEVPLEDNRSASRPAAQRGRDTAGHLHRFSRASVAAIAAGAGLRVAGDVADPLPFAVHSFWSEGAAARARAGAKTAVRRALFTSAPGAAERAFTLHYAVLLLPRR